MIGAGNHFHKLRLKPQSDSDHGRKEKEDSFGELVGAGNPFHKLRLNPQVDSDSDDKGKEDSFGEISRCR